MDNSDPVASNCGKGRPQAPMKFERYAIAVGRTNMGATFKAAAETEIKFVHLDPISKAAAYKIFAKSASKTALHAKTEAALLRKDQDQ